MRLRPAGPILALTALLAASLPSLSASAVEGVEGSDCAWAVRSDPVLVNVLYPDADATYYIAAVPAAPGVDVRIQGQYPHARYASFVAYDGLPIDALADVEIPPDAGSTNPFLRGADRTAPERAYSLALVATAPPEDPADRSPGTLYLGKGQLGAATPVAYVFYRVYLPDAGMGPLGGVPLPVLDVAGLPGPAFASLSCDNLRGLVPSTEPVHDAVSGLEGADLPATGLHPAVPEWEVESGLVAGQLGGTPAGAGLQGGPGSNPHARYLSAAVDHGHGEVLALRFRAPTTPPTRDGQVTMADGQLRYWSVCMNSRSTRYVDCISDSDAVPDPDGSVTVVVSDATQRPADAVNWLPFGPEPIGRVLVRHLLPDAAFLPYSAQGWVAGGPPPATTLGPYMPRAVYCAAADFDATRCGLTEALADPFAAPPASEPAAPAPERPGPDPPLPTPSSTAGPGLGKAGRDAPGASLPLVVLVVGVAAVLAARRGRP